jgi:uncharacterized protein YqhQ
MHIYVNKKSKADAPKKIDFAVGGQAVIEGVMMRSPNGYTISVRAANGKIKMKQKDFTSATERVTIFGVKPLGWPLLRGVVHLVESMIIGISGLNFSNSVFLDEDFDESKKEERSAMMKVLWGIFGFFYMLGTLGFTLFLLKFLPLWVAEKAAELWPVVADYYILFNAIDGLTKIAIFLAYILGISLLKDIRRVFQYHGAEHKSIWVYESGLPLTVPNARKQTRFHPRCGTSFIFFVILMSVLIYTLVPPADDFWMKLGQRLMVLPVIAGVSYETLKLTAKFSDGKKCDGGKCFAAGSAFMKLMVAPGLLLQRLTTLEPDDEQLEVALHSLEAALKYERRKKKSSGKKS